jgi:hypothetical protein
MIGSLTRSEAQTATDSRSTRRLLVAGMPRSGTSWLAKALSLADGFTYYREPDNPEHVSGAKPYFRSLYLSREMSDPGYESHIARALDGRIATPFTLAENLPLSLRRCTTVLSKIPLLDRLGVQLSRIVTPRPKNVLAKLVFANLTLERLAWRFPFAKQVYIVRHPCGQFESWKRQGWEPRPEKLLGCTALREDHLELFEPAIRSAETFWERAGAYWGAINYVIHRQSDGNHAQHRIQFEWLCEAPTERMRLLSETLRLNWNTAVERFLQRSNKNGSDLPYSLERDSRGQIAKWKQVLRRREIDECRKYVELFGIPLYPEFEPIPSEPSW